MSKPTFTPGPWRAKRREEARRFWVADDTGWCFLEVKFVGQDPAKDAADARLIEAAPEMRGMLLAILDHEYNPIEPDNQSRRYTKLKAFVDSITGSPE